MWRHRSHTTMNAIYLLFAVSLLASSGSSIEHHTGSVIPDSETVTVTYHVRSGNEAKFQEVLKHAWEVYRNAHLVFAEPHVVVEDTEDGGKPVFLEIFTWISSSTPEDPPDNVKAVWQQEESLCEGRDGNDGIQPEQVKLIADR